MENKKQPQINISMPNLINICVDEKTHGEFSGRLYHCYEKEAEPFYNVVELLRKIEDLFDRICFPQASTKTRCFREAEPTGRIVRPEKLVEQTKVIEYRGFGKFCNMRSIQTEFHLARRSLLDGKRC